MILAMKVSASKSARQAKVCACVFHMYKSNTMYSCEKLRRGKENWNKGRRTYTHICMSMTIPWQNIVTKAGLLHVTIKTPGRKYIHAYMRMD
jgi:hypothetical protein